MPDLTSPSPFILTHFEQIATVSALFALCLSIAVDVWWTKRSFARKGGR